MIDPFIIAISLGATAGILLGTFFFGGLWWTVRRAVTSHRPALWFFGSLILRMVVALAGFYFIGRDDWRRMIACLAGFLLARHVVMRLTATPGRIGKEASHAP